MAATAKKTKPKFPWRLLLCSSDLLTSTTCFFLLQLFEVGGQLLKSGKKTAVDLSHMKKIRKLSRLKKFEKKLEMVKILLGLYWLVKTRKKKERGFGNQGLWSCMILCKWEQ